ncbi:MAG: DUF1292 domain-containing protein [Pseudobutyrivibrio sp.]|nr:DUF1292 domain-containing protein [Pseudobutyrivibrio sp.]
MDEMKEYAVFTTTTSVGDEVEMAVVGEFEYKNKKYIAASLINGDEIDEDNVYLYKVEILEDDFKPVKITNNVEYNEVSRAYLDLFSNEE